MSHSHILYWIWLSLCVSPGSKDSDILLEYFDESAQKIYEAEDQEYDLLDLAEDVKARLKRKDSEEARKIFYWCREHDVQILAYDDPQFPARLRRIGKRPVLLYCKGKKMDFNDNLLLAMVGTRRMSSYGERTAYTIAHDVCCAGAIVVSGMAAGVDSVCHRGALDAGGDTIAILGCGIDITYPKQNLDLMLELEKKGLVISEFKPGTRPGKSTFPIRNRIISGICQGTLVIEGDKSSGAMITARCAVSQGRDLFALPGMVGEQNSEGTNALLRNGATPVTNAAELLSDYSILYPNKIFVERIPVFRPEILLTPAKIPGSVKEKADNCPAPSQKKNVKRAKTEEPKSATSANCTDSQPEKDCPKDLTEECQILFKLLDKENRPLSADQLSAMSGLNVPSVMTSLTILAIKDCITALPGGRFILK